MELGEKLKEARESKGLSLYDVQEKTKIQKRYLEAIELGNYSVLPGSFYTRAFIREFALVVGLNPNQLLEEHASELPTTKEEDFERLTRVQKHKKGASSSKNSAIFSVIPRILTALLIIGIIAAVWFAFQKDVEPDTNDQVENPDQVELQRGSEAIENDNNDTDQDNTDADVAEESEEPNVEDETEEEPEPTLEFNVIEQNENGTPSSIIEVSNFEELVMKMETEENSWLEINNVDGNNLYRGDFSSDESPKEFKIDNETELRINVGLSANLKITLNDSVLEYPFDSSQPKYYHQIITLQLKQ